MSRFSLCIYKIQSFSMLYILYERGSFSYFRDQAYRIDFWPKNKTKFSFPRTPDQSHLFLNNTSKELFVIAFREGMLCINPSIFAKLSFFWA